MRPPLLCTLALVTMTAAAAGQSFNIDIDDAAGTAAGVPSTAFGAAANQPGTWNSAPAGAAAPLTLVDLAGAATTVTLTRSGVPAAYSFNNPSTSGDFEKLMDDIDCPLSPFTYTFAGLVPGSYRVYTYAFEPCGNLTYLTNVAVSGAVEGTQTVGGLITGPNVFLQPITHAVHNVIVGAAGSITITTTLAPASPFISINGFQLVRCAAGFQVRVSQAAPGAALDFADACGTPGNLYLNAVSYTAGAFPNGPFFGIDYDPNLITFELGYGPPLFGTLDANGNDFGSFPGPIPSGLTLYFVGVTADPGLTAISFTTPFTYLTL
jgi:hypothetical protein